VCSSDLEYSTKSVNFLDTTVKVENNEIVTDLYCKPTDSHSYLQYSSSHPQRCKDSIPYSQFLRVRRICSSTVDFDNNVLMLMVHFLRRGYPMKLLEEAMALARSKERLSLLEPKQDIQTGNKGDNSRVFLITTYHPIDQTLKNIVFNNWEMLGKSPTTSTLHERKLMLGYRRPKNLKEMLVKANVPYKAGDESSRPEGFPPLNRVVKTEEPTTSRGEVTGQAGPLTKLLQKSIKDFFPVHQGASTSTLTKPVEAAPPKGLPLKQSGTPAKRRGFNFCNTKFCRYCPKLNKSGKITSHSTGQEYNCMSNISCRSSNLIYCISCTLCGKQYVGQTSLRLKDRFVHHFYSIEKED
jgi:hypothetical protein